MLRLRLFILVTGLVLIVNATAFVSCTRDKLTEPTPSLRFLLPDIQPLGDRDSAGVAQEWYAQTSEQLDSLLHPSKNPVLLSGDTILLKPDTLFNLGENMYTSQTLEQLYIFAHPDSLSPTIRSSRGNTGSVMTFRGNNAAGSRFEFRNIEIDCDSVTSTIAFLNVFAYNDARFSELAGNLGQSYLFVGADSALIYDSQLTADRRIVHFTSPSNTAPSYVVDASSLRMISSSGTNDIVLAQYNDDGGSILVRGSYFGSTSSGAKHFLECNTSSSGTENIGVTIDGNSFDDDVTLMFQNTSGLGNITYTLTYTDNAWPVDHCPPAYQKAASVTLVADEMQWLWNYADVSYSYIWANIGEVENVAHLKKYCDSTHYVSAAFALVADTLDDFHNFALPVVKYGFTSGTLNSTATVCWNPGVDKWLAEMDADWCTTKACTLYWEATLTECDSTGTSAEQSFTYRNDTGPCKDPLVCD